MYRYWPSLKVENVRGQILGFFPLTPDNSREQIPGKVGSIAFLSISYKNPSDLSVLPNNYFVDFAYYKYKSY